MIIERLLFSLGYSISDMCSRCHGYGWFHTSLSIHNAPGNKKCDGCKSCVECNCEHVELAIENACPNCHGYGWFHEQKPNWPEHDEAPRAKCLFCQKCLTCFGRGTLPVVGAGSRRQSYSQLPPRVAQGLLEQYFPLPHEIRVEAERSIAINHEIMERRDSEIRIRTRRRTCYLLSCLFIVILVLVICTCYLLSCLFIVIL